MTCVCIIQARTGSTRLPGKVLADLGGRPLLAFLLDRLRDLPVERLVVATSSLARDDPIDALATTAGVDVVRGSEDDVLDRFGKVLDRFRPDTVVRLTGDCPLTDPEIVMDVLRLHSERDADYTSNVLPRTFPKGLDVEVVSAAALRVAVREASDPVEREHVLPFLYRRPERFRLANLRSDVDLGSERWVVDTATDLERVRSIAEHFAPEVRFDWRAILAAFPADPRPAGPELALRLAGADDAALLLEWRNDPETIRQSGTGQPVDPATHGAWFAARMDDPATRLWIAERLGEPVAQLRIDVETGVGIVSVGVAPNRRREGIGTAVLRALVAETRDDPQIEALEARIHPDNAASRRAFERAGFVCAGQRDDFLQYERVHTSGVRGRRA